MRLSIRTITLIFFLSLVFLPMESLLPQSSFHNLLPVPHTISVGKGVFALDSSFVIHFSGALNTRTESGAYRFLRRLSNRTGLFFRQNFPEKENHPSEKVLHITTQKNGTLGETNDESYILTVSQDSVHLIAGTDFGVLYGLETLLQLVEQSSEGFFFPIGEISDKPRFPWRGLMIDVSRHFFSVGTIKRNLDAMLAAKLNVFHWHLSDDQGVRVESTVFPQIAALCTDGLYYRHDEIKDILAYADARGIRVIPEFDVPGHSTAWFTAFPELASAPGPYTIETQWGIFNPTFDPTKEETYTFFDKFFGEMAALFPDKYFHIGGDENNGKHWDANPEITKFKVKQNFKDNHELQTYFNNRILSILTQHKKVMIGWDEILQPGMPNNIVIQSWRGTKSLAEAAKKGYSGILSNGYYIDLMQPARDHYLNDPVPESLGLTEQEAASILGGEATMWAELITEETIDSRIWPRTAAIAERFWSQRSVRDVEDMYRRLDIFSLQLEAVGSLHLKNREMMLRRLSGNLRNENLAAFLGMLEPVKLYTRHRQGKKYHSYSPYSRTVDIVTADSYSGRAFLKMCKRFVAGQAGSREELGQWLQEMMLTSKLFKEEVGKLPALKEIVPHADNLIRISEFLYTYLGKTPATAITKEEEQFFTDLLATLKKPAGQTEVMMYEGFQTLFTYFTIK